MIVDEALRHLQSRGALIGQRIRSLALSPYFTVVELEDGNVGAGMSYYQLALDHLAVVQKQATTALAEDALLLEWLWGKARRWAVPVEQESLVVSALKVAVVSALSARILQAGGDETFVAARKAPFRPFGAARRVLLIGYGGYLDYLASAEQVEELHISDFAYAREPEKMEAAVAGYRQRAPGKRITFSDGRDNVQRLREVDAVAITGSTLANGTLEGLLAAVPAGRRVVVQGQSAGIHPKALFDRGVHLVATTLKPPELVVRAAEAPSGEAMLTLLEGGLPPLYCFPR